MATVVGTFLASDDTPDTGRVDFRPLSMAVDDTPDVHFTTRQVVSDDLVDGAFSVEVAASSDSGWRLSEETMLAGGMPYRVTVVLSSERRVFTVYIPEGTSDLSDLVDLDAVPDVITIPTPGPENVLTIGDVVTSAPGSDAEAEITGDSPEQVLNLTLPRGETGPENVLTVGAVTTGAPGTDADVDISGTTPNQVVDFVIPRGDAGEPGDPNVLTVGTVDTGVPGSDADADISGTTPNQVLNLTIPRGDTGDTGPVNTLSIGTVDTGEPGTDAEADIIGIAPDQTLSLTIPRGDKGETPFKPQNEAPANTDTIWYDLDDEEDPFEFGDSAALNVGTTAGTVAAGDDARFGGSAVVNVVAATGATETLPATYAAHNLTMDEDCTLTFPTPSQAGHSFTLLLSGAFTPTWPASVDWNGGSAPTYVTPSLFVFTTLDTGTTWLGAMVGSGYA